MATILAKVLKAQLHTTVHIKDVGQFGPNIDSSEGKLNGIKELTMEDNGRGIVLSGKSPKGPFKVLIPDGNIANMQYDLRPAKLESQPTNATASKTQGPANS